MKRGYKAEKAKVHRLRSAQRHSEKPTSDDNAHEDLRKQAGESFQRFAARYAEKRSML